MSFIVAIDGPAGTGKGTISEILSKKYNLLNIDTGAMYRCVALDMLNKKVSMDDEEKIQEILKNIKIDMKQEKNIIRVFLHDKEVTEEIRKDRVNDIVSPVSNNVKIREKMVELQRKMAIGKDVIMEGRDITTVVFPNADIKIYLDADEKVRAKRRFLQNKEKGIETNFEETLEKIKLRDKNDREKPVGALKKAEDAIYIDTTNMTIREVEKKISKIINDKKKQIKHIEKIYRIRPNTVWKKVERKIIKVLIHGFYMFLFRIKKSDEKNLIDIEGSAIVCANHINMWDAIGIVTCSKKEILFVAKEELFKSRFLNWLAHIFDVIPVKRGASDMRFMKVALGIIKEGRVLGIFPEGTRKGLAKGVKLQNGAVFLAEKGKVPIVPIGIKGDFKPFRKVCFNYGEPIYLDKENIDLEEETNRLMEEIVKLTKA